MKMLKSDEGRKALEELGYEKAKQLFPKDEFLSKQNFVNKMIENFEVEDIFKTIFN
ncbi:hypothetical protein [Cellulophaga lytica]|uniref:hypothetical protein n=1 Tax=Cellulophaga lytica TaxID=979 RepID=UPI0012E0338A|nr:hypothetical protein [Cellulophaga lytica]